jgi:uncharacterized membrane protein
MPQAPQHWETNRVEAFSDGVFAIAITLLVLEIKIDPADYGRLGRALADEWPAYLAYVTSFLTIGSLWIAHHRLFNHLRYVDPVLLRLNLLLLMAVSFLPFPTVVLATAFHADDRAERVAIGFYGATAIVIDLLLRASVRYALNKPELTTQPEALPHEPERPPASERGWRELVSALAYAAGIIAGIFIFPKLAAAVYLAVAIRGALVVSSGGRERPGIRRALGGA